jgi:hypothetical protein
MSRWTPEQRARAAQKRAEAKAPLLAHAGLVHAPVPRGTHAEMATDFQDRMRSNEEQARAHIAEVKVALGAHHPGILAEGLAWDERMAKYHLDTALVVDHWTSLYRRAFGTMPPHLAHLQRALDECNAAMARAAASQGEQLAMDLP